MLKDVPVADCLYSYQRNYSFVCIFFWINSIALKNKKTKIFPQDIWRNNPTQTKGTLILCGPEKAEYALNGNISGLPMESKGMQSLADQILHSYLP